ncbi:MAG TPA: Fic family protein [Kofleriaceae bacterium]|nr:Fic family protein [Kofleriaceae bacterium]
MWDFEQSQQAPATGQTPVPQMPQPQDPTQFSAQGPVPPVAATPAAPAGGGGATTASERADEHAPPWAASTPRPEPAKPEDDPQTLGALLAKTGKSIESLQKDAWSMKSTATDLLKAKGVQSPTQSQIDDTLFQMSQAIQAGTWKQFKAPFDPGVIKLEDGVNERLGNIFFEKKVFTDDELETSKLKLSDREQQQLRGGYESGTTGMVLAASFINTSHRAEGDFSRAYGDEAWRGFVRAQAMLDSIPKGQLLEQLNVDLLIEVNRLIHAPDTGLKAKMLRTIAMIGRGGRWDHGGELREGRQYARPEHYQAQEMENLREAGVHVNQISHDADGGGGKAMLEYPKPEEVRPGLERIINTLKEDLAQPNADPIGAASQFQRHFVALHPFGDSNGRTSRIVMNRILSEFDLPPAILADQNRDISLSPAEWRSEVAKGCARSKLFLQQRQVHSKTELTEYASIRAVPASPDKPITLDGNPFDLGTDGLLYDPTGRPWVVEGNEVIPLAQLEHYVFQRRVLQAGPQGGGEMLKQHTEQTRALYDKVAADPEAGKGIVVRDDARARKADAEYKLAPDPEVAQMLAQMTDVGSLNPSQIFAIGGGTGRGTVGSATISKYAQIDLELWYVERGLREGGHDELVQQVHQHRAKLFEMAKTHLATGKDATRVSADNPMGFHYRYEQMMYDTSPLRFGSFDEALAELGDKRITVWRGDYSFARIIGMAPNNDIRQPDAKKVASDREDKAQLTNLFDDLVKLEGSAVGRQYICTTSDLALLKSAFANSQKSQTVSINMLPQMLKEMILSWMDPEFPEGTTEAEKQEARKQAIERGDSIVPAQGGGKEIKDTFGIPGTILTVKVVDRKSGQIQVTAPRKAFELVLDKDALLPGVYALGGPSFEAEQEMHGLERVSPFSIKSTHAAEELGQEFPVIGQEGQTEMAPHVE